MGLEPQRFFAICPRGLEGLLADELRALGANEVGTESGGASFSGALRTAYAANLHSRIASRVLWEVARGPGDSEDALYAGAHRVAWERWLDGDKTLRVDVTAARSPLHSLEFAMLRIKDAIVDRLRERTGARPSVDRTRPDVRVFAHLDEERCTIYLDLTGEALFKRGWRADKGEAPLKENLAAGLLLLAGWTPKQPLLDPFCGSGTIAIEAASIATRRAPGLDRHFAFERLREFDHDGWRALRDEARASIDGGAALCVVGADISTRVVDTAIANAQRAGLGALIADGRLRFEARDARQMQPPQPHGMIVTNPPYGEQSAPKSASVPKLMGEIGDALKQRFAGWDAWILTSDRAAPRQMRLHEKRKTVLFNGPIECRFFRFELVEGSYRPRADRAAHLSPIKSAP
jgi:putative N6-adenine-specific DNA methylase